MSYPSYPYYPSYPSYPSYPTIPIQYDTRQPDYNSRPFENGRTPTQLPLGTIGWTQDSVSYLMSSAMRRRVTNRYEVEEYEANQIMEYVRNARTAEYMASQQPPSLPFTSNYIQPGAARTYLLGVFPQPLRVFWHSDFGYLSLDNRRLAIFRLALDLAEMMPVTLLTPEAARAELQGIMYSHETRVPAPGERDLLAERTTTNNGGFSIVVRQGHRANQPAPVAGTPTQVDQNCYGPSRHTSRFNQSWNFNLCTQGLLRAIPCV
ncbi:hypothetical protein SISSUDRAFT_1122246 [Sistotremastrum suecicum HHB10207 ss-3]|uniref:Uncharacterized protein n=1 Tax=Sistotremastrum suecicum HHB10207 ss-3 TaxID=1314776 RepID=A0A165ZMD6_9AGAM|nr:hypothetical protein SISSUDRAFT_1122246 [Sistotremastrum suecicum HHB10207 ss-3]